ncbi:hypothetical protein O3597_25900 [Verrucosispora sp. WMMA2044]|uniref:hypothetical protein n=1 Tax=Verrucosispora sp. WMMA2044 TaxID=3016419 RepID=UPI00248B77A2|nr:hypothetical protein [Verrucosispora sp. WMMA2044]WBB48476.1 hypothetical protein O3597_25900 [Verrucosispora sp. WMMA2044]
MTGWSAVAGTHAFVVPGEEQARALAEDLAAYGFALVTARPARQAAGWAVMAFDEGPYPPDAAGHRSIDAVGRQAAAVARRHGGYPDGGSRCDPSLLERIRPTGAPIEHTNPGARPPVPDIVIGEAPPPASLTLAPDQVRDVPIDLSGLDEIAWADLEHVHGPADDVPDLVRALADPYGDWESTLDELFGDDLLHQGTCYTATAPALPFLTRMIVSGALPAKQRLDLHVWLLIAAGRRAEGLLVDADRAAVEHRPPTVDEMVRQVHYTVGAQLPVLLARWDSEPAAIRYALACLTALYPHHAHPIAEHIADMAAQFDGTQPGAYLNLAHALVRSQDDQALSIATDIVGWEPDHNPALLDAPHVPAAVKASYILTEGALRVLSTTP